MPTNSDIKFDEEVILTPQSDGGSTLPLKNESPKHTTTVYTNKASVLSPDIKGEDTI